MTSRINFKMRLIGLVTIFALLFSIIPPVSASAADEIDGFFGMALEQINVYSNASLSTKIGTIYAYEGFSVLNYYRTYAYVEYSTSSGAKRGYIKWENAQMLDPSCIALVTKTSNLYYGTNTSTYQVAGTVYSGELVAVLAKNDDWVYVEYNTTSGRKRGYMSYSNLSCYNRPAAFIDLYTYKKEGSEMYISGTFNVRSGPSEQYPVIGTISNETVLYYTYVTTAGWHEWKYIDYYTSNGQRKSGFFLGYEFV